MYVCVHAYVFTESVSPKFVFSDLFVPSIVSLIFFFQKTKFTSKMDAVIKM